MTDTIDTTKNTANSSSPPEFQKSLAAETTDSVAGSMPSGWSYEATVTEVETIINRIELGELELAEVFSQFSIAVEQLRQCETFLTRQQQQVDLLIETLLDEPEPF